ncbi:MAG: thioredoxin-disulfide reductase [Lachnospiraceae bacterium]|nr:thioredoxin-disulfide reductase [Lachnospiraceae bacterium]
MLYDVIIIGNGPAGLSAAIYGMRAGLKTLVLSDNPMSGGQIATTYEVDNYPGLPKIGGMELGDKFEEHAKALGAEFRQASVSSIEDKGDVKVVVTDKESLETKTVVLSIGADHSKLGVPGEKELTGMGVSYCATCDGAFFRNRVVAVVGGGDVALEDAIFLSRFASKVYLIHRRDEFRGAKVLQEQVKANEKIEIIYDTVVDEVVGKDAVECLRLSNKKTGEQCELPVNGVFMAVGTRPNVAGIQGLPEQDEKGYLVAGEDCATSIPGIYAAGDVRTKQLRQVVTAAADGANAITSIERYLNGQN